MRILNLTQHNATQDQVNVGVIEPNKQQKYIIKELLTFDDIPSKEELETRARKLAVLVNKIDTAKKWNKSKAIDGVMIGGAPFFMSYLETALKKLGFKPLYAFSKREVVEKKEGDSVVKTAVFKHIGFIEA